MHVCMYACNKPADATSISSKGSFICTKDAHTTVFVTPVVEHWLEQKIAQYYAE